MSDLKGAVGELRFTVTVKRKETGKVETFDMVGHVLPEQEKQIVGSAKRGRVHGASGGLVGPGSGMSNQPEEE
jgi:hypothetical protein